MPYLCSVSNLEKCCMELFEFFTTPKSVFRRKPVKKKKKKKHIFVNLIFLSALLRTSYTNIFYIFYTPTKEIWLCFIAYDFKIRTNLMSCILSTLIYLYNNSLIVQVKSD